MSYLFSILLFSSALIFSQTSEAATVSAAPERTTSALSLFDSLHLIGQDGRPISTQRFQHKIVVLNFIFTTCGTSCPVQTRDLATVQAALPKDVRTQIEFVSISVDPERDTPSALKEYAAMYHIDQSDWAFVTGSKQDIDTLTTRFDSFAPTAKPAIGRHTTDVRVFDARGNFMQRYSGVPIDKERVTRELTQLAALSAHK